MTLTICNLVKTDVMFVKIFKNVIFIGNGYYLQIYSKETNVIIRNVYIFDEHIFGVHVYEPENILLVHGGKYIKLYKFDDVSFDLKEIISLTHSDWILTAKFVNNGKYIIGVTMHNIVMLWDSALQVMESKECSERCISYCAHVVNDNWSDLIILSGTVFNQILIWRPNESERLCSVIHRLIGHKGVIFSIDYNPKLNIICTTSDDRTAKIWTVKNETLSKELSQNPITIDLKYSLQGHLARVFKCKILEKAIITAGEDGIINIWNPTGKLTRKIEVHQGGPVWSIDCSEETNEIISSGGDSAVTLFKLHYTVLEEELETNKENPKRIMILSNNSLAYLTQDGSFIRYDIKSQIYTNVYLHGDLKSYGLVEKSPCNARLALAGYHGNIHMYKNSSKMLEHMYSCQLKSKGRIFSLHWLNCKMLLTCLTRGILIMWIVEEDTMYPFHFMQLPQSKEPWSTAACLCGNEYILVGDRRGCIYLYSLESSQPIQIIKRAHNYLGIANLYYRDGRIISLGRNSMINEYEFNSKDEQITQITSHKLPFMWLTGLYRNSTNKSSFLIGFSGKNFIVYDQTTRRTLLEKNCGGGHRSWDFTFENNVLTFTYIKDKRIIVTKCNLIDIQSTNIIEGYHLHEVNALKMIKIAKEKCFFVSGGEDTVIRLSLSNFEEEMSNIRNLKALKSHLSSIRTIAISEIADNADYCKCLMFTGGGRSQIIMWEVIIRKSDNEVKSYEKFNYYEPSEELETRIMRLCTIKVGNFVFLLAGCSDGFVKIFKTSLEDNKTLNFVTSILLHQLKCILQISFLSIDNVYILVTMATDGFILFSNITDILIGNSISSENRIITSIKTHQSGINSFSSYNCGDGNFVLLTGGDDTAIALNVVGIKTADDIVIEHIGQCVDESYHGAQITGAFMIAKYFVTASIDQKVLVFKWIFVGNVLKMECIHEYRSSVCDIQGMECILVDDSVRIFVYGRGCELITAKLDG